MSLTFMTFGFPPFRLISSRWIIGSLAVLVAGVTLLDPPATRAQTRGDVSGIWLTQAGDARIRISKCGGGICGVWRG
jgi:hypothetical protein